MFLQCSDRRLHWSRGQEIGGVSDIIGRVAPSAESARGRLWVGKLGEGVSGLMSTEAWGFFGVPAEVEARMTFFSRF